MSKSKDMIFNASREILEAAWEEAKEEGKQEALSSGVVGEMVELVRDLESFVHPENKLHDRIKSILSKLEVNDG